LWHIWHSPALGMRYWMLRVTPLASVQVRGVVLPAMSR